LAAREEDMKSIGTILGLALSASIAFGASAKEALILMGDVPPGLDYDGPTAASPATQTGLANLLEPLVYYPFSHTNDEGVRILDFQDSKAGSPSRGLSMPRR
jgi:hypothetical protein